MKMRRAGAYPLTARRPVRAAELQCRSPRGRCRAANKLPADVEFGRWSDGRRDTDGRNRRGGGLTKRHAYVIRSQFRQHEPQAGAVLLGCEHIDHMPNIIMAVGGLIMRVIVTPENMLKAGGLQVAMQRGWQPKGQQQQTDQRAKAERHVANQNLKQNAVKPRAGVGALRFPDGKAFACGSAAGWGGAMSDASVPMNLPLVREYFPELADDTVAQLGRLASAVRVWNERINLISRKDADNIEEHHVLHALTMTKVLRPAAGATFADLGTGGGFPGLVLAIVFPACRFTLVDSVGKKIGAVTAMADELGLKNVRGLAVRAETIREKFDYVTGRAVTALPAFLGWAGPLLRSGQAGEPDNGVLYFKGTLWREELAGLVQPAAVWPLDAWVPRSFFAEKFLLHFRAPIAGGG